MPVASLTDRVVVAACCCSIPVDRSGWRNNPALPDGLVYEGLWGNAPQQLYGETGAQSAIVPAFDAVLQIQHQEGW